MPAASFLQDNRTTLETLNNFSVIFTIQNSSSLLWLSQASRGEGIRTSISAAQIQLNQITVVSH